MQPTITAAALTLSYVNKYLYKNSFEMSSVSVSDMINESELLRREVNIIIALAGRREKCNASESELRTFNIQFKL